MSNALLLIGTRKGCFLMESDDDRRKWKLRGPFCEGWPVYHAVYDGSSGAIYAAAASEWLGSTVWRSPDLGETWTQSSEGLSYGEDDPRKVSKVSTLAVDDGRVLVGVEAPGILESRDQGATWSLLTTLSLQHFLMALVRAAPESALPSLLTAFVAQEFLGDCRADAE